MTSQATASLKPTNVPTDINLRQISDWQLAREPQSGFTVDLPRLQRGFVWETPKVLDLWDSILRGFPIGSMLLSDTGDSDLSGHNREVQKYWLLDGQQRATSIAMGFYNPWNQVQPRPAMWSLKSVPVLWIDLNPERREWDTKMFFPYLVTQSHPWGYNQDGGVIPWGQRRDARNAFNMGDNYTKFDLSQCFPWRAGFPVPMAILLETAENPEAVCPEYFWAALAQRCADLPASWQQRHAETLAASMPECLDKLVHCLHKLPGYRVHLNILSHEAAENDVITQEDNSLLFVRLNTGGVTLGGEELLFSLFKSCFPEAKDAVEASAVGFMAPSKLFGLFVRLVAAEVTPAKLSQPVTLREFKKEIHSNGHLKTNLGDFIRNDVADLMQRARDILCGPLVEAPDFCLPAAVATRTINEVPEVFLALLHWLRKGGAVQIGSEQHRLLLGRFSALAWFMPGNARQKQETLREWVVAAGEDVQSRMWSVAGLCPLFLRGENPVPLFPEPDAFVDFLLSGVLKVKNYNYETLVAAAPDNSIWKFYSFIANGIEDDEQGLGQMQRNLKAFLDRLYGCRQILLYAQRSFIQRNFKEFDQWELTLKDTNCPWDWDHIYPSAYCRRNVNPVYRDWHNTIGNLRVEGLSENRSDGCDWPTDKLSRKDGQGNPIWSNSFVPEEIWMEMQGIEHSYDALRDDEKSLRMCSIVLKRLVAIYRDWYANLGIGHLMDEVRQHAGTIADPTTNA